MEELEQLGIIPVDYAVLRSLFSDYRSPRNKIANLEQAEKIIRLKRGVYVVSPKVSKQLLSVELVANHIYGPSYVSMESALHYYGLIPEQVYTIRSITPNRSKYFENQIGRFEYITVNENYYSIGIKQQTVENKYTFLIATPEKALCDMISVTPRLRIQSEKAFVAYLEEDLRLEMSALENMNMRIVKECINTGKKKGVLELLLKLLQ
ncbi:type IV toxin-antitoxin system AbiEi family antitoxin domain-containing protein [Dysgonomonas termitidis]|uniref:Transcriptional regulator, AbiEi antitoxin, Type IV TA system n=1 Tax=Dysgonomonas termitidis TaxID=1516126 RepID=A0ABV9KSS3_9BACT